MNQSQRMTIYNKAKNAAKHGATTKSGLSVKPEVVNRALGVLQRKDQTWRTAYHPYCDGNKVWHCACPDHTNRGGLCKHIVAIMLEHKIDKPVTPEFVLPDPATWYVNSNREYCLVHYENGSGYRVHIFSEFMDKDNIVEIAKSIGGRWANLLGAAGFRKHPDEQHI